MQPALEAVLQVVQDSSAGTSLDPMDLAATLATASPALMLAMFIIALIRRWLVLPRELDAAGKRIEELEKERDEFKLMAFSALNVGERVTNAVEARGR